MSQFPAAAAAAISLGWMRGLGLVWLLALGGCIQPDLGACGDLLCPADTQCVPALGACYAMASIEACGGADELAACALGNTDGVCHSGVCVLPECGNGFVDGPEDCEGDDLRGATCESVGFDSGTLGCTSGCRFDTSACVGLCGDGQVQSDEACDGTGFAATCKSLGYYNDADATCSPACTFNTSECVGRCGDDIVNGPELCDNSLPTRSCSVVGFDMGPTSCSASCGVDLGGCVTIGWSVEISLPFVNTVYVRDTDDIYVGGNTIYHSDGTTWSQYSPYHVERLTGLPTGELYALDYSTFDVYTNGLRKSYTVASGFSDIYARSPTEVYLVGGAGAVRLFDGMSLSTVTTGLTMSLRAVDGNDDVLYAVGDYGHIQRFDGSWQMMPSGVTAQLQDVWVGKDGDAWAVGGNNTILHLVNGSWVPYVSPADGQWTAVWGDDGGNIIVGGRDQFQRAVIVYFDGLHWHQPLFEYAGFAHFDGVGRTVYGHVDGSVIKSESLAWDQLPTVTDLRQQADGAYIAPDGTLFTMDAGYGQGRLNPEASSWTGSYPGAAYPLGFWVASPTALYAVGISADGGWLAVNDGTDTWTEFVATGSPILRDAWGLGVNDVYAVGDAGAVYHFNGNKLSAHASALPATPDLFAVWADSANDLFVAGTGGKILRYQNNAWTEMASGTTSTIRDLWGVSGSDLHAVGDDGTVLHYDGVSWSRSKIQNPPLDSLRAISGTGTKDIFAAGNSTYHFDGNMWSPVRMPGPRSVGAVYATPRKVLFVDNFGRVDLLLRD